MTTHSTKRLVLLFTTAAAVLLPAGLVSGQTRDDEMIEKFDQADKFRQLEEILPTPNGFRTASGAPAAGYWQQRADYIIDVALDDENQRITGSERITYWQQHDNGDEKQLDPLGLEPLPATGR